jgi:dolichol-phosphate mannosyltransferase
LEYGFKDHAPSETEPVDPRTDYAVTKAWATMLCRQVALARTLPIATLRLYSVYGPWEDPRRLIPTLIRCGREGRLPPLVDAESAHDFVYVDDVVDAYIATAERPRIGAIYNIGTGQQTTMAEVVATARRVFGIAADADWGSMPSRAWDSSVWVANIGSIKAELGWAPRYDFDTGFRQTAQTIEPV